MTAPPTTMVMRIPEPWLVNLPNPLVDSGKMHGHMTELKSPQETMAHNATWPEVTMVITTRRSAARETNAQKMSLTCLADYTYFLALCQKKLEC